MILVSNSTNIHSAYHKAFICNRTHNYRDSTTLYLNQNSLEISKIHSILPWKTSTKFNPNSVDMFLQTTSRYVTWTWKDFTGYSLKWVILIELKVLFLLGIILYCKLMLVTGIILGMRPAHDRRCYNVKPSFIGWAHAQNDPSHYQHMSYPLDVVQRWPEADSNCILCLKMYWNNSRDCFIIMIFINHLHFSAFPNCQYVTAINGKQFSNFSRLYFHKSTFVLV